MIDRKYPQPHDPRMKSILEAIYSKLDEMDSRPASPPLSSADKESIARLAANQAAGLLGAFGQQVLGQSSSTDPLVSTVGTGNGTVTSFSAGDLSPLFTTNEATPTTTPTLSFAQVNQNANLIFSGPATGAAGAPTFRAMVAADLPVAAVQSTNSKVTAAAPYTNDGYVIATINGVAVKLMTTA